MEENELKKILQKHKEWLANEDEGERADLSFANLRSANLSHANLSHANLRSANLSNANLSCANLTKCLANEATSGFWLCCPEEGSFTAYKKCMNNVIVKLKIPKSALRSSATTRKCRASQVKVVEVFGSDHGISSHDEKTFYEAGKVVKCDNWCEDRWQECAGGIHFFMSRQEAENYGR
ncbi:MAG: pentapeptide repeat-containing protein [Erythrobacter sp.]|nr:pentapeptide repeat-containing protein [Erythrobacter sp.]